MALDIFSGIKNTIVPIIFKLPIIDLIIKFTSSFIKWVIGTWTGKIAVIVMLCLSFVSIDLFLPILFGGIILAAFLHFYILPTLKIPLSLITTFAISLGITSIFVIIFWKRGEATLFVILLAILIVLLFLGGFL